MVKNGNINLGVIMGGGIILLILVFLYMNSGKVNEKFRIYRDNGNGISDAFQECVKDCKESGYSKNDKTNNTCRNVCFALGNGICNFGPSGSGPALKPTCASDVLKKYAGDKTHQFATIKDREAKLNNAITYYDRNNKIKTSGSFNPNGKACPNDLNPLITSGEWGPDDLRCV